MRKLWTNKEIGYLLRFIGRKELNVIAKDLGRSLTSVRNMKVKQVQGLRSTLFDRGYLNQGQIAIELGLTIDTMERLIETGNVEYMFIGGSYAFSKEEYERLKDLFGNYLSIITVAKIFGVRSISIKSNLSYFKDIKYLDIKHPRENLADIYINKKEVLALKQRLKDCLTVEEYAEKHYLAKGSVKNRCARGTVEYFKWLDIRYIEEYK